MKKPYKIKIGDYENFFLDEILLKVKERAQYEENFIHNKNHKKGEIKNGKY